MIGTRRISARLRVSVTDAAGRPLAAQGLSQWLVRAAPATARGALSVALVDDRAMRRLNRAYRGVDQATDVLTFPAHDLSAGRPAHELVADRPAHELFAGRPAFRQSEGLGDIAIAMGVARRQARTYEHALRTEIRILALHGLLHLLGYDHETDRGQMRRMEDRLRRRAGLPASLIARVAGGPGRP